MFLKNNFVPSMLIKDENNQTLRSQFKQQQQTTKKFIYFYTYFNVFCAMSARAINILL